MSVCTSTVLHFYVFSILPEALLLSDTFTCIWKLKLDLILQRLDSYGAGVNGACIEDVRFTTRAVGARSPSSAPASDPLEVLASHDVSSGCAIEAELESGALAAEGRSASDGGAGAIDDVVSVVPLYVHEGVLLDLCVCVLSSDLI